MTCLISDIRRRYWVVLSLLFVGVVSVDRQVVVVVAAVVVVRLGQAEVQVVHAVAILEDHGAAAKQLRLIVPHLGHPLRRAHFAVLAVADPLGALLGHHDPEEAASVARLLPPEDGLRRHFVLGLDVVGVAGSVRWII